MPEPSRQLLRAVTDKFTRWLDTYGETSWDSQAFYASRVGRAVKQLQYKHRLLDTAAVARSGASSRQPPSDANTKSVRVRFQLHDRTDAAADNPPARTSQGTIQRVPDGMASAGSARSASPIAALTTREGAHTAAAGQ
jgi:hypothetical protein